MSLEILDIKSHVFSSSEFESYVDMGINVLIDSPVVALAMERFRGAGIYVLYYNGNFEHYKKLSIMNEGGCEQPIYVGKAVPQGWRTARVQDEGAGWPLHGRIREHTKSIQQGAGISVEEFRCKFMVFSGSVVELIPAVESQLIQHYKPLWNSGIDGFGNHDPGSGRYNQRKSEWDILHPGRSWSNRMRGKSATYESVAGKVTRFLG